jgi:hypothetical protein
MNAFTPGARRAAEAREAARILGEPTYHGQPCAHGHSGQRYTSNKHCFECHALRTDYGDSNRDAIRHNTILTMLYPQEFDAMGWRMLAVEDGE